MKSQYYLVWMQLDVEPVLLGPYPSPLDRERALIDLVRTENDLQGDQRDGIFFMSVDLAGKPNVASISGGYMESIHAAAGLPVEDDYDGSKWPLLMDQV